MPNLNKLDNNPVTNEEKAAAMGIKLFINAFSEEEERVEQKKEKEFASNQSKMVRPMQKE